MHDLDAQLCTLDTQLRALGAATGAAPRATAADILAEARSGGFSTAPPALRALAHDPWRAGAALAAALALGLVGGYAASQWLAAQATASGDEVAEPVPIHPDLRRMVTDAGHASAQPIDLPANSRAVAPPMSSPPTRAPTGAPAVRSATSRPSLPAPVPPAAAPTSRGQRSYATAARFGRPYAGLARDTSWGSGIGASHPLADRLPTRLAATAELGLEVDLPRAGTASIGWGVSPRLVATDAEEVAVAVFTGPRAEVRSEDGRRYAAVDAQLASDRGRVVPWLAVTAGMALGGSTAVIR